MSKIKKRHLLLVAVLIAVNAALGAWWAFLLHEDPFRFKVPPAVGDFGGTVGSQ